MAWSIGRWLPEKEWLVNIRGEGRARGDRAGRSVVYVGPASLPNASLFQELTLFASEVGFIHRLGDQLVRASASEDVCRAIAEELTRAGCCGCVALFACSRDQIVLRALVRSCGDNGVPGSMPAALILTAEAREQLQNQRGLSVKSGSRAAGLEHLCQVIGAPELELVPLRGRVGVEGVVAIGAALSRAQRRWLILAAPVLALALRSMADWAAPFPLCDSESSWRALSSEGGERVGEEFCSEIGGAASTEPGTGACSGEATPRYGLPRGRPGTPPLELGVLGGLSRNFNGLVRSLREVSRTDAPVLIHGPQGTEKVLLAGIIHRAGPANLSPLFFVDCEDMELTGLLLQETAEAVRNGLAGTLLIDCLERLSPQGKGVLQRLLADRVIRTGLGGDRQDLGLRLLATSCLPPGALEDVLGSPLWEAVGFRTLRVPPLEERACDVPLLASQLVALLSRESGSSAKYLAPEAMAYLMSRPWTGNMSELFAALREAVRRSSEPEIDADVMVRAAQAQCRSKEMEAPEGLQLKQVMAQLAGGVEAQVIAAALARTGENRTRAARLLGIGRRTLLYKIKEHSLSGAGTEGKEQTAHSAAQFCAEQGPRGN